jgi:GT2 family glycosyltransferase
LEKLGEALVLNKKDNVRMVVPLSDNPGDCDALRAQYDEFKAHETKITIVDDPLPMYCFMCHRALFQRVGLMKPYPFVGYEADEFAFRMRHYGYKQAIAHESWVHHDGSATINNILKTHPNQKEVEEEIARNRERCITETRMLYANLR